MKIGDKIVYGELDGQSPLKDGIITKVSADKDHDYIWINNQHKPEDCIHKAYVFPIAYKSRLESIIIERQRLKAAYDESVKWIYQLRNDIANNKN